MRPRSIILMLETGHRFPPYFYTFLEWRIAAADWHRVSPFFIVFCRLRRRFIRPGEVRKTEFFVYSLSPEGNISLRRNFPFTLKILRLVNGRVSGRSYVIHHPQIRIKSTNTFISFWTPYKTTYCFVLTAITYTWVSKFLIKRSIILPIYPAKKQ
jgi:hypothetical protein